MRGVLESVKVLRPDLGVGRRRVRCGAFSQACSSVFLKLGISPMGGPMLLIVSRHDASVPGDVVLMAISSAKACRLNVGSSAPCACSLDRYGLM